MERDQQQRRRRAWAARVGYAAFACAALAPGLAGATEGQAEHEGQTKYEDQSAQTHAAGKTTAQTSQASDATGTASQNDEARWSDLRDRTVSADELIGANVENVANPVGTVRDLVLTEDGSAVQYVLYEIPYPYSLYSSEDGFVAFDNVALERGAAAFDLSVRFDDPASAEAPERLTLTASQADNRLLSRILGSTVSFAGAETREVEDVLIDRRTGRITHYVVNMNQDALFNDQPHAIPAEQVEISDQGEVRASVDFAALEPIE